MVGNDVVDLGDEETLESQLHPRFDQRVFTSQELAMLSSGEDLHRLRWSVWAAKESSFKLAKRENPRAVFAHRSFKVTIDADGWGTVRHGAARWAVRVIHQDTAVHVICTRSRTDHHRVLSAIGLVGADETPSTAVRRLACQELARELGLPESELSVTRTARRIPELRIRGTRAPGFLSLSHHGRFVAFAYRP